MTQISRRAERERGQSTVEFVLVLPILFGVVLAILQVGLVIHAQIGVAHTAREVARVLAVDPTADPRAAAAATSLRADALSVDVDFVPAGATGRQMVVVQVRYRVAPVTRLSSAVGDIEVSTSAAMLVEQ